VFNFNHLYYFHVAARASSLTAAAASLQIAQPSLSAQLKVLEERLGQQLFTRKGRRLELTENGRRIQEYCRKMFDAADDLAHFIENAGAGQHSRLHIGVTEEVERPFVVELVSRLVRNESAGKAPQAAPMITMNSSDHPTLIGQLREQRVDVVITHQPAFDDDLEILCSTKMPVVLAYSRRLLTPADAKAVRAGGRSALSFKTALSRLPKGWVLPSLNRRLRVETELFLERKRLNARVTFESDVLASVVRAVADGVGVGLLPLPYVANEIARGQIETQGPQQGYWQHGIWLIARRRVDHPEVIGSLRRIFQQAV
jgi:LysR family transcriptional activator of nhaA